TALATGLGFNVPQQLQRLLPDYTAQLQEGLAGQQGEAPDLGGPVTDGNREPSNCTAGATELAARRAAPALSGTAQRPNTANGAPVELKDLRGQVILVDFWAYSCINCQRSTPQVVAWDRVYRDAGLQVVGVHSPEYAFEKDAGNVSAGARDFRI